MNEKSSTEEISGEVLRITYHNPDNSFTVAKIRSPSKRKNEIAIVGALPQLQIGHTVHCQGRWAQDPRHGLQFQVEKVRFELPSDPTAIEKLLSSGFIKGLGPKTAKKIVSAFGSHTFSVLEREPKRLFTIPGLAKKKAEEIINLWQLRTLHEETMLLLLSFGLTQTQAMKALQRWGHETIEKIKENPYLLAQEIHGIGFSQADKIAMHLQLPTTNSNRIRCAILFFLWETGQEGNTCTPLPLFLDQTSEKLGVERILIEQEVGTLERETQSIALMQKNEVLHIASRSLHSMEWAIAAHLHRISSSTDNLRAISIEKAIVWAEKKFSMQFSPGQKEAIALALQNKVTIITGGPGTGKSTITKAVLAILLHRTPEIVLAAPTGRAAKRMMDITHHRAETIHRLLKFDPIQRGFLYKQTNPLRCDVLILDEMSMVDTMLMHALIQAVPDKAKILFIGDVNQLPAIGPGMVLHDLIASTRFPVAHLKEIYRQAKKSNIIENAHRINDGEMPFLKTDDSSDFLFFGAKEPQDVRIRTLELVTKIVPEQYGFDPRKDIQVLAPMRRGLCGIDQLNKDLQAFFCRDGKPGDNRPFLPGDKVIQLKNNYSKEVFNGDIGTVHKMDLEEGLVVAMDDRLVSYDGSSLEQLSLAWAVSVHKYQGSEAPCIVIPIHTQHFALLTRNLLYTAVTRGRKLVILVGSIKAIAIAIHNTAGNHRWTFLQETLSHFAARTKSLSESPPIL